MTWHSLENCATTVESQNLIKSFLERRRTGWLAPVLFQGLRVGAQTLVLIYTHPVGHVEVCAVEASLLLLQHLWDMTGVVICFVSYLSECDNLKHFHWSETAEQLKPDGLLSPWNICIWLGLVRVIMAGLCAYFMTCDLIY